MEKKPDTLTGNFDAVKAIADRIKNSCDNADTTQLMFTVDLLKGKITKVEWSTVREISFDSM